MIINFVKLRREFNKWWDNYAVDTHYDTDTGDP
jgi:hypothetical protein